MDAELIGRLIFKLIIAVVVIWGLLKMLVFVRNLLRPVTKMVAPVVKAAAPVVDKLDAHVEKSLRSSGLGAVADLGAWGKKTARGAIQGTSKALDAVENGQRKNQP